MRARLACARPYSIGMTALFSRRASNALRVTLLLGALLVLGAPVALMLWVRSPDATGQGHAPEQPMWFSHRQHVKGYGLDCRYCHSAVERSATAGMPATRKCLPCHQQKWLQSGYFAPVRRSLSTGRPLPWRRVYDLPDFVYFNHAIHVQKGVGCESCHGRVDRMDRIEQAVPLSMGWCLQCHRDPRPYLRPRAQITTMGWRPARPQAELGAVLARRYRVRSLTACTNCHR